LPKPHAMRDHRSLQSISALLHDPNLWHLNRHSVSVAAFVGIFVALLPIPLQMLAAAAMAVWLRCNLTLAVALVWITNPLTMPLIYYMVYRVGTWLLGMPHQAIEFEMSWGWLQQQLGSIWLPLLVGSVVSGLLAGTLAWLLTRMAWRVGVQLKWRERLQKRAARRKHEP
jgi:uncharacterized protein